jgi:hypothetical protein
MGNFEKKRKSVERKKSDAERKKRFEEAWDKSMEGSGGRHET